VLEGARIAQRAIVEVAEIATEPRRDEGAR
jgi:hypothetical protein